MPVDVRAPRRLAQHEVAAKVGNPFWQQELQVHQPHYGQQGGKVQDAEAPAPEPIWSEEELLARNSMMEAIAQELESTEVRRATAPSKHMDPSHKVLMAEVLCPHADSHGRAQGKAKRAERAARGSAKRRPARDGMVSSMTDEARLITHCSMVHSRFPPIPCIPTESKLTANSHSYWIYSKATSPQTSDATRTHASQLRRLGQGTCPHTAVQWRGTHQPNSDMRCSKSA